MSIPARSDLDEAVKRLEEGIADEDNWCFCVSPGGRAFTDVRLVLDALSDALAEIDHLQRFDWLKRNRRIENERDEARAEITRLREGRDVKPFEKEE